MEKFFRAPTKSSPLVDFDPESRRLTLSGASYPENTAAFYEPAIAWLRAFLEEGVPNIDFDIELKYFDSSSSKVLMDIFDLIEDAVESAGTSVVVNWRYLEIDTMSKEYGEEFLEDLNKITFNLVSIPASSGDGEAG